VLEQGSKNDLIRGCVKNLQTEEISIALELSLETVEAVIAEMRARRLIFMDKIANWDKRQPMGDVTSADRSRYYRERKKTATVASPSRHGTDTDTDTDPEGIPPIIPPSGETPAPRGRAKKKASTIEPTWQPDEGLLAWAQENHPKVDAMREVAQFVDYHTAKGSLSKDWKASYRLWLRNADLWARHEVAKGRASRHSRVDGNNITPGNERQTGVSHLR
jgi:hypothetical protein